MSSAAAAAAASGAGKGAKRRPQPHRCNDRAEDLIQGLFEGVEHIPPLASRLWECVAAEPGKEPDAPYRFVTPQASKPPPPAPEPEKQPKKGWWGRLWGR
mmetsp:Transcript_21870/g.70656  ORF Transcript_21870/g.70656 Transcript_21870/m.70656 type:complete len:100 (+) Transcript_21870:169-468(+)